MPKAGGQIGATKGKLTGRGGGGVGGGEGVKIGGCYGSPLYAVAHILQYGMHYEPPECTTLSVLLKILDVSQYCWSVPQP